jgi:glucan phosphoethanolaminetransferase (alkaline phosphatase superfamily)
MKKLFLVIGLSLLVIGFSDQINVTLTAAADIMSITKELFCVLFGMLDLVLLAMVDIKQDNDAARQSEETISALESRLCGKVITMSDYREYRRQAPKAEPVEQDEVSSEPVLSDKEAKYARAQAKMDNLRKNAPPAKSKKPSHIKYDSKPSLKERAGGIRRAS